MKMRRCIVVIILTLFCLAGVAARAQTPPLFPTNAKYLGYGGTGGGTANAQTITYSPALAAYTTGQVVSWVPSNANTTAATLNVNGLGAKPIKKTAVAALVANDLLTTAIAIAFYDGTNFQLINPQTGSGTSISCASLPALLGDTTSTVGTCNTATSKINGTSFPTSATAIGSNSSAQPVAAATSGTGTTLCLTISCVMVTPNLGTPTALVLTSATGLPCGATPANTGDVTKSAGSCATTVTAINGTAFSGTNGHLVSLGASNTPADSGVVAADVTTQAAATSGQICTYTGSNRICVPATALPNGVTATTQTAKSNDTKVATDAYVDRPVGLTTGTSVTLAGPSQFFVCTGTCTITVPVPAAGNQFCVWNDDNISSVITFAAIGSSSMYENQARTAYGTAGTGTLVAGGAVKDLVCIVGKDSTHYQTINAIGTWTVN